MSGDATVTVTVQVPTGYSERLPNYKQRGASAETRLKPADGGEQEPT